MRNLKECLRSFIKRHKYLCACYYMFLNLKSRIIGVFSEKTSSGATHASLDIEGSLDYISGVFQDYQKISGCKEFHGKVAELGPGDSDGVGLMFLAHGAKRVDLADRFFSWRSSAQQKVINQALQKKYPNIHLNEKGENKDLHRYYGKLASGERFFKDHEGYDLIVSRSVLEHVNDLEIVLFSMYQALNKGGMLLHKVDLRDHGMVTPYESSVKFLEIPEKLYRMMVSQTGYPNRMLFHRYKEILSRLFGGTCRFYIAALHNVEDDLSAGYAIQDIPDAVLKRSVDFIEAHREKFCKTFKNVPNEDLAVSSFFFVCQK